MTGRVVFLVPRREDGGHRDALWVWARARWEAIFPGYPIYEGHHDTGPFNRSAAVNLASDLADEDGRWDVAIVIDSDVFIRRSAVVAAVERASETGRIVWPHTRWRGISELWTKRVVEGRHDFGPEIDHDDLDVLVDKTNAVSWSCCIAIPRAAWERLGGFDERFRGWGFEDMAFQSAAVGLVGHERIPNVPRGQTDVFHLWHPRSDERITQGKSALSSSKEYIANGMLGRRYMVALRRDHDQHDRIVPWAPGERERDIENLRHDEAKMASIARRHGLPDWSGWWPTLDELVEGAKAYRVGPSPSVALIVRTGGEETVADERIAYLERSLASLVERTKGTIARRVIYSDWDASVRPRVDELAARFGFYVVGDGHHGYTESVRRLWRYIGARVTEPFVFLVEDDFLYLRDVPVDDLVATLRKRSALRQVALLRGPVFPRELEHPETELLGWPRDSFEPKDQAGPTARLEHRLFWTMNPSVFPREVADTPWPSSSSSERVFGDVLLRDRRARFAFAGDGEPWIEHIGTVRSTDAY